MHETLSENSSTDVSKSERNIVNEPLSQNHSADISDNTVMEINKKEHKEPSVIKEVKSYFNILKCGRNLLDQIDVKCQQAFMATPQDL